MKHFPTLSWLFCAAALVLAALPGRADDAPKVSKQPENRFLFVIDNSHSMRGYAKAVAQSVVDLMNSDMRGEFRQGDTLGLWLYNDRLDPQYPMQVWSKSDKDAILTQMATYLLAISYEKFAHFDKVMPALNKVIKGSERITIILISDGSSSVHGTPFDKDIRKLQKKYERELRAAGEPLITVLAARDGAVFDYTINYPGPVAIPHTANPEEPVVTNAPAAPVAAVPVPATNAPPKPLHSIILSHHTNVVDETDEPLTPVPVATPTLSHSVKVVPAPPPVVSVATPPLTQPAIISTPPPVVAQTNPPPAAEIPVVHAPAATISANEQPPPTSPPVAQNIPAADVTPTSASPLALFAMAFLLLALAALLVVILIRRSRHAPQSSLISQSIDRPH